jgi:hypothetical protein
VYRALHLAGPVVRRTAAEITCSTLKTRKFLVKRLAKASRFICFCPKITSEIGGSPRFIKLGRQKPAFIYLHRTERRFIMYQRTSGLLFTILVLISSLVPTSAIWKPVSAASGVAAPMAVTIPAEAVRDVFWMTHVQGKLVPTERLELMAFSLILQQLFVQNRELSAVDGAQQVRTLQARYAQNKQAAPDWLPRTDGEQLLHIFAILATATRQADLVLVPMAAAAREAFARTLDVPIVTLGSEYRIHGAPELQQVSLSLEEAQQAVLQQSLRLGRKNPEFGQAFDALWADWLEVSIFDQTQQLVEHSAILQDWSDIRQLMDASGVIQTSMEQLQTLVVGEFDQINSVAEEVLAGMSSQEITMAVGAQPAVSTLEPPFSETEIKNWQETLAKAKPKIDGLATFVTRYDADLGRQISVVGNSAVKMADSMLTIALGITQLVSGPATLIGVATGVSTLVKGVIGLTSAFKRPKGQPGPTPEQMILNEIYKLQQQVAQLRTEMHERFDRIDRSLNLIMRELDEQFAKIEEDFETVQKELLTIEASLHRFEQNMYKVIADGFLQPLWLASSRALNFPDSGELLPYNIYANVFAVDFHTWVTYLAYTNGYNPPPCCGYDNSAAYDQLRAARSSDPYTSENALSLDRNINFLFQVLHNRWPELSIADIDLSNPVVWAVASRAYLEMALDWPDHALRLDLARSNAGAQPYGELMQEVGRQLQRAFKGLSTTDAGKANYDLFNALFANYQSEVASLEQELQTLEASYLEELRTQPEPDRSELINLWGGANQVVSPPTLLVMQRCDGNGLGLSTPTVMQGSVAPPFRLAHYLTVGAVEICVEKVSWFDIQERTDKQRCGKFPPRTCYDRYAYGYLDVTLQARYNGQAIASRFVRSGNRAYVGECHDNHHCFITYRSPDDGLRSEWEQGQQMKLQFEDGSKEVSGPDENHLKEVSEQVNQRLLQE